MNSNFLSVLNPVQREAVTFGKGPLLILAGAGSGKTRVLTYRIAYLVRERKVNPANILAITFTNKAADEMRQRVENLLGQIGLSMWISTFHSACVRILRREIERLGYKKSFIIYDEYDSKRLVESCLKELDLDTRRYPPAKIASIISSAKNDLIDPDEFSARVETYLEGIVASVYKTYQTRLFQANALDFDDLIMVTVNLFELFPSVLEAYQNRFHYILVDEYQDTNHAQYKLVRLLSGKHRNICVVGDDDQSVYSFRGADIRNILEFERDWPDCKILKLEQNYRSTKTILEAASQLVRNNRGRKDKRLWTANSEGELVARYQAENEHDEAEFIAGEIERLVDEQERRYQDFAIFYRTNAQSRVIEEVFLRYGLPYKIVGGFKFYERQEIKDVLAYLKVISNPLDTVSLKRIINVPKRRIGETSVSQIESYALEKNISFYEAVTRAEEIPWLSEAQKERIKGFVQLIEGFRKAQRDKSVAELAKLVVEKSGYLDRLKAEGTIEASNRLENVNELLTAIGEFENMHLEASLADFLAEVSLLTDIDVYDEATEAVTLMTLHNAKGLEFPVVFITGMEEGIFPHIRSLTDTQELEEERRLCYVGMTRAKEKLYLINALSRNIWGGSSYNLPSRFLKEIPESLCQQIEARVPSATELGHAYQVGDQVFHETFGRGKVVAIKKSGQVEIIFDKVGEKTLHLDFAPMRKISS
jgi:DNA helicase-2/ATP-dependent DNA helicase PcrA